jgi:hypothetical protein
MFSGLRKRLAIGAFDIVSRHLWLPFLVCVVVSVQAAPVEGDDTLIDKAKLGRYVLFPGIQEPVRVRSLEAALTLDPKYLNYRLPTQVVHRLIQARDRNANWLLSERRKDYLYVSYTFHYSNNRGTERVCPTAGKYDRGVYLKLPSEYVLYYGDYSKYDFQETEGYFRILVRTGESNDSQPVPGFISWADVPLVFKPLPWWTEQEIHDLLFVDPEKYAQEFELLFSKVDGRLVKEYVRLTPLCGSIERNTKSGDVQGDVAVREIRYSYEGEDYPAQVLILSQGQLFAEFLFDSVHGFWMMRRGGYYKDDDGFRFTVWLDNVGIHR